MALDLKILANRLKQARENQSLDIDAVNQGTGIKPERLKSIESGHSTPSGDEVLILATYYRHDFRVFLDHSSPAPFEQMEILYRRYGEDFLPKDRRAIQEFLYLCEIETFLESELERKKQTFSFMPKGKHFKTHGERAASALRLFLGYAKNAIPRDVFDDFRQIGFHIFRRCLVNSSISGLYINHPMAGHCLLVNYDEDVYRQRFSACHEAAHAIFDSTDSVSVSYKPKTSNYSENQLKEVRANHFASCYLLPPELLPKNQHWTEDLALSWAQQFRVSTTALSYSLEKAGLVNDDTAKMIRSVSVPSTEKIDPEASPTLSDKQRSARLELLKRGLSDYYVDLCFEAHHREIISAGRLREALLSDHVETHEISALYGRTIQYGD